MFRLAVHLENVLATAPDEDAGGGRTKKSGKGKGGRRRRDQQSLYDEEGPLRAYSECNEYSSTCFSCNERSRGRRGQRACVCERTGDSQCDSVAEAGGMPSGPDKAKECERRRGEEDGHPTDTTELERVN